MVSRECGRTPRRHRPPTDLAFGEPDDRLRRAIQYSEASVIKSIGRGVLDTRLRGYDGLSVSTSLDCFASLAMTV
jgi:hypothetical protein